MTQPPSGRTTRDQLHTDPLEQLREHLAQTISVTERLRSILATVDDSDRECGTHR